MDKVFNVNIEELTKKNNNYRQVLYTDKKIQLVIMSIKPNQEIGMEIHPINDQFIRIESGMGIAEIGKNKTEIEKRYNLTDGSVIIIPAGTWHNIKNNSNMDLKLYTIYSPPTHKDKLIQKDKPLNDQEGGNRRLKKYRIKYRA